MSIVTGALEKSKHAFLHIQNGHLREFKLFNPYIKIDKTPKKITKDSKKQDAVRKGRQKYMNNLKKIILNEVTKGANGDTSASAETQGDNASIGVTNTTTSVNTPATLLSLDLVISISVALV